MAAPLLPPAPSLCDGGRANEGFHLGPNEGNCPTERERGGLPVSSAADTANEPHRITNPARVEFDEIQTPFPLPVIRKCSDVVGCCVNCPLFSLVFLLCSPINREDGVRGSCSTYKARKEITETILSANTDLENLSDVYVHM